jgi:isovaleryl-CoA dehydrogenase
VPKENVLGAVNQGVYVMMSGLDYERLVLSGGPLGLQQACLDVALPYAAVRTQFGNSIGSFQLIQAKLADMYVALESSRALVYSTARATDAGAVCSKDCAAAILLSAESATKSALEAIQVRPISCMTHTITGDLHNF